MELFTMIRILVSTVIFLVIVPFYCGIIPVKFMNKGEKTFTNTYVVGFITYLCVFELVYTPFVLAKASFTSLCYTLGGVFLLLLVVTLVFARGTIKDIVMQTEAELKTPWSPYKLFWIIPLIMVGFQLYMSFFYQYQDGDDAYYVTQSLMAFESDKMYFFDPYVGITTELDIRHALAGITIFISFLSKAVGVHPTVMSHSIFPLFIILAVYMVYYNIGKKLFREDKKAVPIFLSIAILMQLYGNTTIFTNATFLLTRTWQGKAVIASLLIPATFLALMQMSSRLKDHENDRQIKTWDLWIYLTIIMIAGVACTAMGVYLLPLLEGLVTILFCIFYKKPKLLVPLALSIVPCGIYGVLYVVMQL